MRHLFSGRKPRSLPGGIGKRARQQFNSEKGQVFPRRSNRKPAKPQAKKEIVVHLGNIEILPYSTEPDILEMKTVGKNLFSQFGVQEVS